MGSERRLVVITGFGPFGEHTVNSSWEAVQVLGKAGLGLKNAELQVCQLPVSYDDVMRKVPEIWSRNPDLVIHVGVMGSESIVQIEGSARKAGYCRQDIFNNCPSEQECCLHTAPSLCTQLNLNSIHGLNPQVFKISNCAGNYLCEFTYYISLGHNPRRALFIHVPPLDKPFSKEELADFIRIIALECLAQLEADLSPLHPSAY